MDDNDGSGFLSRINLEKLILLVIICVAVISLFVIWVVASVRQRKLKKKRNASILFQVEFSLNTI